MYCMIVRNQMKPGQVDAVVAALEKDFVPVMKKSRGFRGCYMMAGPKGEYTAFVLWRAAPTRTPTSAGPNATRLSPASPTNWKAP